MSKPQNTGEASCSVCGVEIPRLGFRVIGGRKTYCHACKSAFCPDHREETAVPVAAGVDSEVLTFTCPKGHPLWDAFSPDRRSG